MIDANLLVSIRDDAIKICDIVDRLCRFSDVGNVTRSHPLGATYIEFKVPSWEGSDSEVRRHRLPRVFWGSAAHYFFAFRHVYRESLDTWIEGPAPEHVRFIALANGVTSPRYQTISHFRATEFEREEWTNQVKTAHEVAVSLWEQRVKMLRKYLPLGPKRGERKGKVLDDFAIEYAKSIADWNPKVDSVRLRDAILDESMRAILVARGASPPPPQNFTVTSFILGNSSKSSAAINAGDEGWNPSQSRTTAPHAPGSNRFSSDAIDNASREFRGKELDMFRRLADCRPHSLNELALTAHDGSDAQSDEAAKKMLQRIQVKLSRKRNALRVELIKHSDGTWQLQDMSGQK